MVRAVDGSSRYRSHLPRTIPARVPQAPLPAGEQGADMNGKLARTTSRREVSGAQIVQSINRERNRTMARTKRSRRAYSAGEWGRNRVRVFPDPRTGIIQVEWRENGRRLTRSLKQRTVGGPNRGRRSRKSNWDCTICHSCRSTGADSAVSDLRENRNCLAGIQAAVVGSLRGLVRWASAVEEAVAVVLVRHPSCPSYQVLMMP